MWCSTDDSEGGSFVKPSVSNDWKEAAKSELVSGSGDIWMAFSVIMRGGGGYI